MNIYEISKEKRTQEVINDLVGVWERSVRASHTFLAEDDIDGLKPFVNEALGGIETLIAAHDGNAYVAFIGIQDKKIEMLFVSPAHFGEGIGKRLVPIAIQEHGATLVDVNEQNPKAAGIYRHMGFRTFRRDAVDDQGNPFPILRMSLAGDR